MFWRFGAYANISTIDNIIDKGEFTLEELLDEGDLIQELKQHNAKLIDYLRNDAILEKLLNYVTTPKLELVAATEKDLDQDDKGKIRLPFGGARSSPRATENDNEDDEQEKKRNRYAFVAAEVLSSDNWSIHGAIMENQPLLRKFWDFLKREAPLDPLQASYFTKVNEALFDKKTGEMLVLLKSVDGAVKDMLRHVDCPMIMDLLLKIITLERAENGQGQGVVEWLFTQDLMPILLSLLGAEHNWATQTSAGDFMKAIITVSANASQNEQTCIGPNELTRQLVSRPCVDQLIQFMLGGGNPLTVGVGIVIEVIRKNNSDYDPDVGAEPSSTASSRDPIYLGTLLRMFADHVPDFMSFIMNTPAQEHRLDSTFGTKIEPLGFDRFKTCELMAELLHCSNMGLLNEVGSEELIATRDAERQKLRKEGKLAPVHSEDPNSSSGGLTMRLPHAEERKLEVTNVSDDDGFEQVTHSKEMNEDTSHEFVKAEEEIPKVQASSILGKDDDDFVDEPLTSPRPQHATLDSPMDDVDLIVAPLSPTKKKPSCPSPKDDADTVKASTDKVERLSLDEKQEGDPMDIDNKADSDSDDPESPLIMTPTSSIPETQATKALENKVAVSVPKLAVAAQAKTRAEGTLLAPGITDALVEQEPGEASIIVGHRPEERAHTPEAPVTPVVGDYLKMQFVEYNVVPTILSFFFRYPWNNFLHNVVYDVVQQVFNGPMDRGYNPTLAISLFEAADVTAQIINGQTASEESQTKAKTRMGFMGHLTLIAEEVVKFTERHPPELLSDLVMDKVLSQSWISYVEGPLAETRERDNAILGGVRPEVSVNKGFGGGLGAVGLSNLGGGLGHGGQGSSALADAGLNGGGMMDQDGGGGDGIGPFAISAGTLMSGFGSSSDEDEDENEDNEEDINNEFRAYTDPLNNTSGSFNPPSIPPPPPPPPPLNIPPSRARMQLAARLALHNQKNAVGTAAGSSATTPANSADTTSSNSEEAEFVHRIERAPDRPRNPFADDEDDDDHDDDGIDSDDDDDDPAAPPPGSSLRSSWGNRGGWWREVLNRGSKGRPGGGKGVGRAEGDDNDSIGDEEDETGSTGAEDYEEFGEFAMPELRSAPQVGEAPVSGGSGQKDTEEGSGESDKEPEKVILKPLPVHPPASKTGFSSLWPFGGEKKEGGGGDKGEEEKEEKEKSPAEEGIKKAVAARRRMSIEEPDDEEVVV